MGIFTHGWQEYKPTQTLENIQQYGKRTWPVTQLTILCVHTKGNVPYVQKDLDCDILCVCVCVRPVAQSCLTLCDSLEYI